MLPITRMGAEPGAETSGVSQAPGTGQSVQLIRAQPRKSPKTGDAARKEGSFAFVCSSVNRSLKSAQLIAVLAAPMLL